MTGQDHIKELMTWGNYLQQSKGHNLVYSKNAPSGIRFAAEVYLINGYGHPHEQLFI